MLTKRQQQLAERHQLLLQAAKEGDLATIIKLVLLKVNLNIVSDDETKSSPIRLAAEHGHHHVVKALLELRVNPNALENDHSSPLRGAAFAGHAGIVRTLIQAGAIVDAASIEAYTAMHYACFYGHLEVVKVLLHYGADLARPDKGNETPLTLAASYGFSDIVSYLISQGADIEIKGRNGSTGLLRAAFNGKTECVKIFLEAGANIHAVNNDNYTALHLAAVHNHVAVAELLIKYKANLEAKDKFNATPLIRAVLNKHYNYTKALITANADVNALYKDQQSSLYHAISEGDEDIVELLLNHGAKIDSQDEYGQTPLFMAAGNSKPNTNIITAIVNRDPNVNLKDSKGRTPLVVALALKSSEVVSLLLNHICKETNEIKYDSDMAKNAEVLTLLTEYITNSRYYINEVEWFRELYKEFYADKEIAYNNFDCLMRIGSLLYKYRKSEAFLEEYIKTVFIAVLKFSSNLMTIQNLCDYDVLQSMINKLDGKPVSFLHTAFQQNDHAGVQFLLKIKDNKPDILIDSDKNSLLHVCDYLEEMKKLLPLYSNIDIKNQAGDTVLHDAAKRGQLTKVSTFLRIGASPDLVNAKGLTVWQVLEKQHPSFLTEYRTHYLTGVALFPVPLILKQEGNCCGFYAIHCAIHFLYMKFPELFSASPMLPRKRKDKTKLSMRKIGKDLGITKIGEIYTAEGAVAIINKAGCRAEIIDILKKEDYAIFIAAITNALQSNFPIILPYSVADNSLPLNPPEAESAHWATIIGYHAGTDTLLTAQYAQFYQAPARDYFTSFFDMPDKRVAHNREKRNGSWCATQNTGASVRTIAEQNLTLFRRKLIVVKPPEECVKSLCIK